MLPVPEQYLNSRCEMRSMDGRLILLGCVSAITEEGLKICGKGDRLPLIHCNTAVRVNLFNSESGFRAMVGKVYLSTEEFIRVVELQSAADYEKRNFFRVKTELTCSVLPDGEPEENAFFVTVEDMSLGGLFFRCGQNLEKGRKLTVRLTLSGAGLTLACRIIRIKDGSSPQRGYGCAFLETAGKQFDLICKYLFDCQREQIRRMEQAR